MSQRRINRSIKDFTFVFYIVDLYYIIKYFYFNKSIVKELV